MEYSYPLLRKVFNYYHDKQVDISGLKLFSCQHLLAPQYEMYKLLVEFGFDPKNITALGKVYSSNKGIIADLQSLGIKVIQPEFDGLSFDEEHRLSCIKIIKEISDKDKNIILDDGGYLIYEGKDKNILFGVEQTSSGFQKLKDMNLSFPVLNVARSNTKLVQESLVIGKIVLQRLKEYLSDLGIASPKVLIVGLGPIGNSLLKILTKEGINVSGFDIDMNKESLLSYLRVEKPDITIGATGAALFDGADLDQLDRVHLYHFISVSSSDREFPVASFRKDNLIHNNIKYKNFVFVNNGFPIVFKGNKYECTPQEIEKTIALLMGSVMHGVVRGVDNLSGIIEIPEVLEELINS